ncbi:MAG: hypothetical protein JRJ38_18630 [Deltaproteobacteria bacterium]|nr:hypothetical protein [Deltaproteobacteria bacterium]
MADNPLKSLASYSRFVAELLDRSTVLRSTVVVRSDSPYTGTAEGEVSFSNGFFLRMREELDFEAGLVTSYGYEVYQHGERLYWYDDFPHPNDRALASTFPHHKHVPPDIRHNRIPAPEISFSHPNLPVLIRDVEELIKA